MVLLTTIFAFYEMKTLRMDNSNEAFFLEGDPTKLLLDKFRDTFGNDDFVYVLVETDDFFRTETIRLIKTLAQELEAHVPYIKDMKFLGNVEYVEGMEGWVRTSDLEESSTRKVKEKESTEGRKDVLVRVLADIASLNLKYPRGILGIFVVLIIGILHYAVYTFCRRTTMISEKV